MSDEPENPTSDGPPPSTQAPEEAAPPSGLKNPDAAVRGVGAATLGLEFLVLLLAIQPLRLLLPDASAAASGLAAGLALLCLLAAGLLRYRWAWQATTVLQVVVVLTGIVHWMLGAVGLIFLLVWIYVLNVRKTVLGSGK
ncbi:DUF4233 domain-containing protein [Cryptosporangium minutisporangium]|uniref:DUF4233 domain-containing protein n=1 Tax=Cryptosporangium minutisporangium TaxID=113569 RepID=A0ABP6T6Q2_9ACTN